MEGGSWKGGGGEESERKNERENEREGKTTH